MHDPENLSRIDETIERAFEEDVPPEVEERLTARLRAVPSRVNSRPPAGRQWSRARMSWSVAAAVAVAGVLVALWSAYWTPAMRVYAAAMSALENVGTIHVLGYGTSSMFREHERVPEADRYVVEAWMWSTAAGVRTFQREGPVVQWDDGHRRYRYYEHQDTLRVDRSIMADVSRDLGARFFIEGMLGELRDSNRDFTDLGERLRNGRRVRIIQKEVPEAKRKEWWFDLETSRLVHETRHKWKDGRWVLHWVVEFTYGEEVPAEVAGFSAPEAKHVEHARDLDPRYEAWELHVQRIQARYETHPLPELMELLPREEGVEFEVFSSTSLHGHYGYFVDPLQESLHDFLFNSFFPAGSVRVTKELQAMRLNHDLVVKLLVGEGQRVEETSPRAQCEFVLEALGLELVETLEERDVWIAQYDGRPLKPWREVQAPVADDPNPRALSPPGARWGRNTAGISVQEHFRQFNWSRDQYLTARKTLLVDDTGIPEETPLTEIVVNWYGPDETLYEIAREWFEREFGITFVEGRRWMAVFDVRKK